MTRTGTRRYEITHRTTYRYSDDVTGSYGRGYLTPRELPGQRRLSHELLIEPEAADSSVSRDAYGNTSSYFHVTEPHRTLTVTGHSLVEVDPPAPELYEGELRAHPGRYRARSVPTVHSPASSPWILRPRRSPMTSAPTRRPVSFRSGR